MKLNLTYVGRKEVVSQRTNKPFTSISIKCTQYGDKYLSGFGNKGNEGWKSGDEVEVEAVTEKVSGGKTYLNFEMPKRTPNGGSVETMAVSHKLDQIIAQNRTIIDHLSGKNRLDLTSAGTLVPTFDRPADDIDPNDIPFN